MKKILALCLALTMALAVFAGCSGAASSSAPAAGSASGSASTGGSATGKQLSGKVVYWSMYNEGEPEAMAIQKAADMFMEDYPDCEVEIQWIGRSNQDITGPALEGGEQLDILDNFSYDKSTDRYLDITDMMNEPALGQEDMTVAESILPVLNLANAQGQERPGWRRTNTTACRCSPGWWASSTTRICSSRRASPKRPRPGRNSWKHARS